jgi:hypothetical protein
MYAAVITIKAYTTFGEHMQPLTTTNKGVKHSAGTTLKLHILGVKACAGMTQVQSTNSCILTLPKRVKASSGMGVKQ